MLRAMDVPVLPSHHTDYASDATAMSTRHQRLPLGESTGNVQVHNNTAGDYCVPVNVSNTASASLPLVSCGPSATTPTSIPTPPIVPTQSRQRQQQSAYHTQQPQHGVYSLTSQQYPYPQQPYQHHQQHHQQHQHHQLARRSSPRHHDSLALAGPLSGNGLFHNPSFGPDMGAELTAHIQAPNANVNPIYLSPQFQAYRKKQAEKDDKAEQIWPDVLEDAFLDALLLIPQMGRKKYAMRGQLHGRNMLISEYLWVSYCLSLPPGTKPDRKMARGRKQVSSHIQVLKNFFIHHRCYHFFFPSKERKEDTRSNSRDSLEKESFKDNLVLRALFEGRMPDERPNYEYFGELLASDALVAIRPNLCWILVSSAAVRFANDGPNRGQAYKMLGNGQGDVLDSQLYPHLHLNHKREEWPERGKIIRGTLLQEYTRALSQKEATSVREVAQDWEERFPGPMMEALDGVVRDDLRDILHFHVTLDVQEPDRFPEGSELNSLVEVTIEQPNLQNHRWKSVTRLARPWELMPAGTQTVTSGGDDDQVPVSVITRDIGNQYRHLPNCQSFGSSGHCDCFHGGRGRRQQQLAVPFPAPEWATMLSMLTSYRKHALDEEDGVGDMGAGSHRAASRKRSSYSSTTTATTATGGVGDETGDDSFLSTSSASSHGPSGPPTQMDLVRNIAMLQELWSCDPNDDTTVTESSPTADGTGNAWTRRGVIVWTFETIYSINERKKEVVKSPAGTGWRFLTTIDPTSQYHQKQALVTPGVLKQQQQQQQQRQQTQAQTSLPQMHPQQHSQMQHYQAQMAAAAAAAAYPIHRDNIMSPHPGYQQHLNATMSEHLSATWDPSMVALAGGYSTGTPTSAYRRQHHQHQHHQHSTLSPPNAQAYGVPPQPLSLLGATSTTPPSSALPSPYATSFEGHAPTPTAHNGSHPYGQRPQQPQQSLDVAIDPFLAASSSQHSTAGSAAAVATGAELPNWDTSAITSALDGWTGGSGNTGDGVAAPRGQKRGRGDDGLDTGPVASMRKLSHNRFSNWR